MVARRLARAGALSLLALGLPSCRERPGPDATAGAAAVAEAQGPARRSRGAPRLGEPAPAYRIGTLGGDSLVVGPSRSVVLLNVWATWCASCKEEFAHMDSLLARHRDDGLRVVAVSVDVGDTDLVRRTIAEYAATFEVAHDQAGEVEARFPALGVPASYVIDRDGVLRWRHVGVLPAAVDSVLVALLAPSNGADALAPTSRPQ